MTREQHTPGPWRAVEHYSDTVSVVDRDGFEIAEAHDRPILLGYAEKLAVDHWADAPGRAYRELTDEQQAANARLIAASPTMLEALQDVVAAAAPNERDHPAMYAAWINARAAIAKATGETA